MIALGIILLIIGFVAKAAILWTIGIILAGVGAVLLVLGSMGRAVGGPPALLLPTDGARGRSHSLESKKSQERRLRTCV